MPEYVITDLKPKPKARPRHNGGVSYMPKDYMAWRRELKTKLLDRYPELINAKPIDEPFWFVVEFWQKKKPRGDTDNLLGGILDAIQTGKYDEGWAIIQDDKLGIAEYPVWIKSKKQQIVIQIHGADEAEDHIKAIVSAARRSFGMDAA